jgi:HEAT repeat protein
MDEGNELARAEAIVARFATAPEPWRLQGELRALGSAALPAVRDGLQRGHCQVRRWCTIYLDHDGGALSLAHVIPLLDDPKSNVRMWAVHTLACDRCRNGENPIDVTPLLIERVERDESIRVRRMATVMLATVQPAPDPRALHAFREILARETDAKLRLHATFGLGRARGAERREA